jgi:hypothetical protein
LPALCVWLEVSDVRSAACKGDEVAGGAGGWRRRSWVGIVVVIGLLLWALMIVAYWLCWA